MENIDMRDECNSLLQHWTYSLIVNQKMGADSEGCACWMCHSEITLTFSPIAALCFLTVSRYMVLSHLQASLHPLPLEAF